MYNALKRSWVVPAIDTLLITIAAKEAIKAAMIAVGVKRAHTFKCSIILSPPHALLPAEWVAVLGHHAWLIQIVYRHFCDIMKSERELFVLPFIRLVSRRLPSVSSYARTVLGMALYPACVIGGQKLPMEELILAGKGPGMACVFDQPQSRGGLFVDGLGFGKYQRGWEGRTHLSG